MLEICAELRHLDQSRSLITCADGTQLILQADSVPVATVHRVIMVDITSPDAASCGLKAIRTLVPSTVGNTLASFPYLGNDVVVEEAVRLKWRETPLEEEMINDFPMPHA